VGPEPTVGDSVLVKPGARAAGRRSYWTRRADEQAATGGRRNPGIRLAWQQHPVEDSTAAAHKQDDCAHDPTGRVHGRR